MASLINRIQRAFNGSAGPDKVRALLAELAIPAGGSGENALCEARRGFLRPISDEAILRDALGSLNLTGSGTSSRSLIKIRSSIFHNRHDSETILRDGLNDLLETGDLAGGGDTPAWVPDNAVIYIDLIGGDPQGRAWVEGAGEVAVATLLGEDVNTENSRGTGPFDENGLVEGDGFLQSGGSGLGLAYLGALRTAALAGATIVVRWKHGAASMFPLELCAQTGNLGMGLGDAGSDLAAYDYGGSGVDALELDSVLNLSGGLNAVAVTVTPTRFEFACNGSSAVGATFTETSWPAGGADQIVAALWYGMDHHLQSIAVYDALPNMTGLPALSE